MKKLGFIVEMKDCKDAADLRRWVDLAQQQGIDGVELLFNSKCGVDFSLDKIKPAFENTPVEPAACGLWWLNTIGFCAGVLLGLACAFFPLAWYLLTRRRERAVAFFRCLRGRTACADNATLQGVELA